MAEDGTPLETIPGDAGYSSIASNGTGYAVAWHQYNGSAVSIFANSTAPSRTVVLLDNLF